MVAGCDCGGTGCLCPAARPSSQDERLLVLAHFVGKVATFSLLYAFPLVLLGSGEEGWHQLAWVVGWAFAIWGTALYWYAGGLYALQTVRLLRSTPPSTATVALA